MEEPIVYVGGQTDSPRRRRWPYFLLPGTLMVALVVAVVLWGPISGAARGVSDSFVPYNVNVDGAWSTQDVVSGGPVSMLLTIENKDSRSINGVTIRLKGLSPAWRLLGAGPEASIRGAAIYFPRTLKPGGSEDVTIRLMPVRSGTDTVNLSFSAGQSTLPMQVRTGPNSVGTAITATATVREPTADDMSVEVQPVYDPQLTAGQPTSWDVEIQNAGAIRITSVTLGFPNLPDTFQLTSTEPPSTVSDGGRSLRFATVLDPGDATTMTVHLVPHRSGNYHVAIQLYLSDQPDPSALANGDRAIVFDVSVS
jgi:hypothetical protein